MKMLQAKPLLWVLALALVVLLIAAGRTGYAATSAGPLGFTPTEPKVTEPPVTEPPVTEPPATPIPPKRTRDPQPTSRITRTPTTGATPSSSPAPSVSPLPGLKVNGCTATARYMVKFVCGLREKALSGEPPVKPGNYATAINLHNYNDANACGMTRPALAVQVGAKAPAPIAWQSLALPPVSDLELDCNYLWSITGTKPGSFLMGMLDIGLSQTLPVAAVYTAAITDQMELTTSGAGISIDVEYIQPFWR